MGQASKIPALRRHEQDLSSKRQDETLVKSSTREIGYVFSTSGYRTVEDNGNIWGLDWALVRLRPERTMTNVVQGTTELQNIHVHRDLEIDEWSKEGLQSGLGVSKRGRTTDWTEGSVNGINATSVMERMENSKNIKPYTTIITAMVAYADRRSNKKFYASRDSGSLILASRKGTVVGLLLGHK